VSGSDIGPNQFGYNTTSNTLFFETAGGGFIELAVFSNDHDLKITDFVLV
jgi:hypothetical protein